MKLIVRIKAFAEREREIKNANKWKESGTCKQKLANSLKMFKALLDSTGPFASFCALEHASMTDFKNRYIKSNLTALFKNLYYLH